MDTHSLTTFEQSLKEGVKGEDAFVLAAKQEHFIVRKSSVKQNIFDHIDFFIRQDRFEFSVDVKARKRINRKDKNFTDESVWIEFKGIKGHKGWLYGKADYIAFERLNDFILIKREELLEFCEENVDLKSKVEFADQALYKGYERRGKKDLIARIKMSDLNKMKGKMLFLK